MLASLGEFGQLQNYLFIYYYYFLCVNNVIPLRKEHRENSVTEIQQGIVSNLIPS
jgi:hypothetical protein